MSNALRLFLLALSLPLLIAATPGQAGSKTWPGKIEAWDKKWPTDRIGGRSLYQQPGFRTQVTKLVGKDVWRSIERGWRTTMPVTRDGDFFLVQGCKSHACPVENFAVLVDRNQGVVGVCLGKNDGQGIAKRWIGPDQRPPRETHESDTSLGCSGDPAKLIREAKLYVLPTAR